MSEILSDDDGLAGRRKPAGAWLAPFLVVVAVALLCSGVLSTDPEPRSIGELMMAPTAVPLTPTDAGEEPGPAPAAPAALVDGPDDFAEFGFDSRFGAVSPRGATASGMPAVHPGDTRQTIRPM